MSHSRSRWFALTAVVALVAVGASVAEGRPQVAGDPGEPGALGYPFHVNERTTIGTTVGPVQLKTAQFRLLKSDEIETLLYFYCEKGKDQSVTYEVVLLGVGGSPVLEIKDKKGIEETDHTTFRRRQGIPPGLLDSVRTFRVTFSSVPD